MNEMVIINEDGRVLIQSTGNVVIPRIGESVNISGTWMRVNNVGYTYKEKGTNIVVTVSK